MADFENQDGDAYRLGLRDSLMAAVEEHREEGPGVEQAGAPAAPAVPAATDDQAAQRARDDAGRFTAKSQEKPVAAVPTAAAPAPTPVAPIPAAAPPSSWKKEQHEAFSKLDPNLQNYIRQRETEYNTGVATYRAEAEKARVLNTALEPFLPAMQQHNVQPGDWIRSVGQTHELLLRGSPQQKFATIVGLARDYGVDLSPLTGGQAQPQGEGAQQQPPHLQANPEIDWLRNQISTLSSQVNSFTQQRQQDQQSLIHNEIQQFSADTTKYPHFEALRESMARLLESGLAQDLSSAYDKALRMNDDLWNAQQASDRQQAEAIRQQQATEQAAKARAKVVSVKSATPSATPAAAANNATDRRSQLAEAFSQHSGGGRV